MSRTLSVTIRYDDVLHFLGYTNGRGPSEPIDRRIRNLLEMARELVAARGTVRHLPLEEARDVGLDPIPATGLVIGLVTVGSGIEKRATELADRGDSTSALLLDAMGSAAVEEAADRIGALVASGDLELTGGPPGNSELAQSPVGTVTASQGPDVDTNAEPVPALSCRISPGYGRWPLTAQTKLFERLPHEEVGVSLLPSYLMLPRKSISFAMWMGAEGRPIAGLSGCDRCGLEHCQYRRSAQG